VCSGPGTHACMHSHTSTQVHVRTLACAPATPGQLRAHVHTAEPSAELPKRLIQVSPALAEARQGHGKSWTHAHTFHQLCTCLVMASTFKRLRTPADAFNMHAYTHTRARA